MGFHQELPVYKAIYGLLIEIFQFTKDFSTDYKYTVGESLKKKTIVRRKDFPDNIRMVATTTDLCLFLNDLS
jgi:hypothetical protein